jgi:IMP dehydrogenase
MRRAYGFDEVAIVPGDSTINPSMTELSFKIGDLDFPLPFMAAAMDAVVDPEFAVDFGKHGGLAVLNLEGVQTRYADPRSVLKELVAASPSPPLPRKLAWMYWSYSRP